MSVFSGQAQYYVFVQAPGNSTALTVVSPAGTTPDVPEAPSVPAVLASIAEQLDPHSAYFSPASTLPPERLFASTPYYDLVNGGVSPWNEAEFVPSLRDAGLMPGGTSRPDTFSATGDALSLRVDDQPRPPSGLSVYSADGDGTQYAVADAESSLKISPAAGEPVPFPDSFDRANARSATTSLDLPSGPVELTIALSPDGFLLIEIPEAFARAQGLKGAVLAGLLAAKRELGALPASIKAVEVTTF